MTRINEYGEIIRDSVPAGPGRQARPAPTGLAPAGQNDFRSVVGGMMLASALLLGALGMLVGHGAGARWCRTEPAAEGAWKKDVASFLRTVYLASWSRQPVQHAVADASTPVRLVVIVAAALVLTIALAWSATPSERLGMLASGLFWSVPLSILLSVLLRLLFYLLTWPVTWFVNDISGPSVGLAVVGLSYAVLGAMIGFPVGLIVAATRAR